MKLPYKIVQFGIIIDYNPVISSKFVVVSNKFVVGWKLRLSRGSEKSQV